jgi:colanic acid/amylovoran biosynthesis glycosyltransferase
LTATLGVWRDRVLPYSETFVLNQIRAFRAFQPTLIGIRDVAHSLDLGNTPTVMPRSSILALHSLSVGLGPLSQLQYPLKVSEFDTHLIHFQTDAALLLPLLRRYDGAVAVVCHGYDVTREDRFLSQGGPAERALVRRRTTLHKEARLFIAVSNYIADRLVEQGAPSEKIEVLPIGVPVQSDHSSGTATTRYDVAFVGRIAEKKGVADLLDACKLVQNELRIAIVGAGEESMVCALQQRSEGLAVDFLGAQNPAGVKKVLSESSVFVAPSKVASDGDAEGFGMVFLEAALAGIPVVAYRSGGVGEAVVHGETGFLVDENDIGGLASRITALVDSPDLRARMGNAGKERVIRDFAIERRTAELESALLSISA